MSTDLTPGSVPSTLVPLAERDYFPCAWCKVRFATAAERNAHEVIGDAVEPPCAPMADLGARIAKNVNDVLELVQRAKHLPVTDPAPLKMPAHFGATPRTTVEREASDNLYRAVRQMARDICDGYAWESARELNDHIAEAQTWPEWQTLRALYFVYCNGFEDALYDCSAVLACAIRDNKPQWIGDVVIDAWAKYADPALVERVVSKIQEIKEDDGAINQADGIGR